MNADAVPLLDVREVALVLEGHPLVVEA